MLAKLDPYSVDEVRMRNRYGRAVPPRPRSTTGVSRQPRHDRIEGRMVVVVSVQQVRLDERIAGQPPMLGVVEEVIIGRELGGEPLVEPRGVDHPVIDMGIPGST